MKKDYARAKSYYEQAAAQGDPNAVHNLGVLYVQGLGVKLDYARAKSYYEQAAAQGDKDAAEALREYF
ncbi:hypothetical protein [Testudinibacter aquarius]|uniref:hypothetical protein n=1 Tax=Testudinibacter aquarius TaxID=1524974 RepID=UPI0034CE2D4B